ncbi:MAG: tetratricopeptide repeat protein [Saprospiraceae bacterium]
MRKKIILCLFWVGICLTSLGQNIFKNGLDQANPVRNKPELSADQKIEIHQQFLNSSLVGKDRTMIFYAYLFLLSDYMRNQDYSTANFYLLQADSMAQLSQDKTWIGHMCHRKAILAIRLEKNEEAIKEYLESIPLCGIGLDSLCVGEAYEQLSFLYGIKGDYSQAEVYHQKALPLLRKYGGPSQIAAALNNYAIIYTKKGMVSKANLLYQDAIKMYDSLEMVKEMSKAMNNLADGYRNSGQYKKALTMLNECITLNIKENLLENLHVNYHNISAVYDSLNEYKLSLKFFIMYHDLRDSLIGLATQSKIDDMNLKYDLANKELKIVKNELKLKLQSDRNRRKNFIIFGLFILVIIGLIYMYQKFKKQKASIVHVKKVVSSLTQNNIDKALEIKELQDIIIRFKSMIRHPETNEYDDKIDFKYNTILTNSDWLNFKNYFQSNHPGYINNLRNTFPKLSDAEERLFLLIKLNHNTKEISAILGITIESVKKTRNRLRKRLNLTEELDLDTFISDF